MGTGYKNRTACCINHVDPFGFGHSGLISVVAALETVEELSNVGDETTYADRNNITATSTGVGISATGIAAKN